MLHYLKFVDYIDLYHPNIFEIKETTIRLASKLVDNLENIKGQFRSNFAIEVRNLSCPLITFNFCVATFQQHQMNTNLGINVHYSKTERGNI